MGGGWGDYYLFFTIAMWLNEYQIACLAGVSGKGFLAPGNGKGNLKSHSCFTGRERETENATGREGNGKFEARNPGNPGKSRESYKKQG